MFCFIFNCFSTASKILTKVALDEASKPSLIRNLFEEGNNLRKVHGNEVLDFSLGNPTIAPPKEFQEALAALTANVCSYPFTLSKNFSLI